MDADGKVGLKTASAALLDEARLRTRGYPRALEALFAILSTDRDATLRDILDAAAHLLLENVVEVLVGEAFSRLDPNAQQVMQALALYGLPVTPAAIDHLLQPYVSGVNSATVLGRLVNMQFARKEAGRYYLHPVDREYAPRRRAGRPPARRQRAVLALRAAAPRRRVLPAGPHAARGLEEARRPGVTARRVRAALRRRRLRYSRQRAAGDRL